MLSRRRKRCALLVAGLSVSVTGCIGETIFSATAKLLGGQISQLTPTEIQLLNEAVLSVLRAQNPGFNPQSLTTAQATALSNFFKANNINSLEDIESLKSQVQNDPNAIQGLDELAAAFEGSDTGIDETNAEDSLDAIVQALFGGTGTGSNGDGDGNGSGGDGTGGAA